MIFLEKDDRSASGLRGYLKYSLYLGDKVIHALDPDRQSEKSVIDTVTLKQFLGYGCMCLSDH